MKTVNTFTASDPNIYKMNSKFPTHCNLISQSLDSDEIQEFLRTPNDQVYRLFISDCKGDVPLDLRHFTNMDSLEIVKTRVPELPIVGENCTRISCEINSMRTITYLPPNLKMLRIVCNLLQRIDARLPDGMITLNLTSNYLKELPPLPEGLRILRISENLIERLPDRLPHELQHLYCSRNSISGIPAAIPPNMTEFHCSHNNIGALPLHFARNYKNLEELDCGYNPLAEIESIPPNLTAMHIGGTNIRHFPELPEALTTIGCSISWVIELSKNLHIPILGENTESEEVYFPARLLSKFVKFRHTYHCVRLRDHFHRWLWKSREEKYRTALHPSNLSSFLGNSDEELEERLELFIASHALLHI